MSSRKGRCNMTQRITRSGDGETTNPSPSSQFKASNGTGASSSALAQSVRPSASTPTSMYPGGAMPCPTRSSGAGVGAAGKAMMGIGVASAATATRGACAKAATRLANVVIVVSRRSTRPTASGAFSDNALIDSWAHIHRWCRQGSSRVQWPGRQRRRGSHWSHFRPG